MCGTLLFKRRYDMRMANKISGLQYLCDNMQADRVTIPKEVLQKLLDIAREAGADNTLIEDD